jgi:hypothetical protein
MCKSLDKIGILFRSHNCVRLQIEWTQLHQQQQQQQLLKRIQNLR